MRVSKIAAVVVLVTVGAAGLAAFKFRHRSDAETFDDPAEHFKYGSIGAEKDFGIPFAIWRVMPAVCETMMPRYAGKKGWENFGFIYESPDKRRPIGTSLRNMPVATLGLNCAACHAGTVRDHAEDPRRIVLGMPAHGFDFGAYRRFLFHCAADDRFNPDSVLAAIEKDDPGFGAANHKRFQKEIIPETKARLAQLAKANEWTQSRTESGPGRADTFNHYKVLLRMDIEHDSTVGVADFPSIWSQQSRDGMRGLWDGSNTSVAERATSTAISIGASPDTLDAAAIDRVVRWLKELPPPKMDRGMIEPNSAGRGKAVYERECAGCHEKSAGQVTPIAEVGTDPARLESFTPELAEKMSSIGAGKPSGFSHFEKTNGYANVPLDGLWLRAPYLHNGSVPTLRDLLNPPDARSRRFFRGIELYDYQNVGFVYDGPPEVQMSGSVFVAEGRGNSNAGHAFGTGLSDDDKNDLIHFLKTL